MEVRSTRRRSYRARRLSHGSPRDLAGLFRLRQNFEPVPHLSPSLLSPQPRQASTSPIFGPKWEHVSFANGSYGTLHVIRGKTAAARRMLPMTPRVRAIFESRWHAQGQPQEGWCWPARTASGHLESASIEKQHLRALRSSGVRPFPLYSLRHTFLTRLGESGCDAWTLARIAGHSNVRMSSRYVHPGEDAVLSAMSRLHEPEPERMLPVSVKTR